MTGNVDKGTSKDIFTGKGNAQVRQDKDVDGRICAASRQPRISEFPAETTPRHHGSETRQTQQIAARVKPQVKEEIRRLAAKNRVSESAVIAALLEKAVQSQIDLQYGALLTPIIERLFKRREAARDARFAALLVRIAYDAGQTRSLVTNLLARAPGISPDILDTIIDQSARRARANLTHLSPQITELIAAVEEWMAEAPEEERVVTP